VTRVRARDWVALEAAARAVLARAHAPYSGLQVAAALQMPDGRIVTGVNVENASYGLTLCAERNALSAAVTLGAGAAQALLLVSSMPEPITPCGACRQVLLELAPEATVRCLGRDGGELRTSVAALLPGAFSARALPTPKRAPPAEPASRPARSRRARAR
jgi:cytidine deaminase